MLNVCLVFFEAVKDGEKKYVLCDDLEFFQKLTVIGRDWRGGVYLRSFGLCVRDFGRRLLKDDFFHTGLMVGITRVCTLYFLNEPSPTVKPTSY